MNRSEVAEWLNIVESAIPEGLVVALSPPLDLSELAVAPGFEELTEHDREQVAMFATLLTFVKTTPP